MVKKTCPLHKRKSYKIKYHTKDNAKVRSKKVKACNRGGASVEFRKKYGWDKYGKKRVVIDSIAESK